MNPPMFLTIDIEDWFQVENLKSSVDRKDWDSISLRFQIGTEKILNLLEKYNTKATFFVLGWIAERTTDLIKKIHKAGHEIASHGYGHELVYNLSPEDFKMDLLKSKKILENITGEKVLGYRAPSFSITEKALDILKEEDFVYDSSYFPSEKHDRYSMINLKIKKDEYIKTLENGLYEITVPTLDIKGKKLPWGGGGYFRLIPSWIYKKGVSKIIKQQGGFIFYLHPWELDPAQPRMKDIKAFYKFRHYCNLKNTEKKLEKLIKNFKFTSVKEYLKLN